MAVIKTRINEPTNNNRFRVTVAYEHGDADLTTYSTAQFQGMSDSELEEWLVKFNHYKDQINNMRWYSQEFDRDQAEVDLKIEMVGDQIYHCDYNYVASISIDKIEWVDDDGIVYKVEVKG